MMKRLVLWVLVLMLLMTTALAEGDAAAVQAKGRLIVGVTDFAPMDYRDASGAWVGFDADLATAFAESLGVQVELTEINWDNKVLELQSGTIDCVWNGMTLTDEVLASMSCSVPYLNNAQVVVLPAGKAEAVKTAADLSGLVLAVEAGSAGEAQADALGLAKTAVASQADALMEVAAGTSDGAVIDALMAAAMVGEGTGYPNLTYRLKLSSEQYGVGFRQGSDLTDKLNAFLADMTANGRLQALAEQYKVQAALIGN